MRGVKNYCLRMVRFSSGVPYTPPKPLSFSCLLCPIFTHIYIHGIVEAHCYIVTTGKLILLSFVCS